MKIIDMRSDTVTLPTDEMRQAMYRAEVGDDVYREDPTINRLEEMAAERMGKEAALFTASGTMSNLITVLTHTDRGDEIILGSEAHMFWHEVGSASVLGGAVMRLIPNDAEGRVDPEDLKGAVRAQNIHYPTSTLFCLENTHNRCGGAILTPEYTASLSQIAHERGLMVHLDGARIFNAAVALGIPAAQLAGPVDTVCFCISKGLAAPVGSLLCGSKDFVERSRKWRKMLGGGMRQAGIIAAAGIVALEKMVDRLAEDHANARRLAEGLAQIPGFTVNPEKNPTNIIMFESPPSMSGPGFIDSLNEQGVKMLNRGGRKVRAVTHCMITAKDIDETLEQIRQVVKAASQL